VIGLVGACGVACEICKAYLNKKCPIGGCTSGKEASEKLEIQRKVLGFTCPVLDCANKSGIDYCMKSCEKFPCEIYYKFEIPYSKRFLDIMKKF